MKKLLSIVLALGLIFTFAACGNKEDQDYNSETSSMSEPENTVKGFSGTIGKKWDSVKDDYAKLETEAKSEIDENKKVTREEINTLVNEIESGMKELENGITDSNEETAKKVYKDAHKLELLAERGETDASKELKNLAKNAKALVKQYYGVADDDYDTVREAVEGSLKKIKNFTNDIWDAFINLFE
ncbi:MAG: hypothetical protein IJJ40_03335 [Clostridia bacterium]|nr:hypothetical protein [Clostridia bacterium]